MEWVEFEKLTGNHLSKYLEQIPNVRNHPFQYLQGKVGGLSNG